MSWTERGTKRKNNAILMIEGMNDGRRGESQPSERDRGEAELCRIVETQ